MDQVCSTNPCYYKHTIYDCTTVHSYISLQICSACYSEWIPSNGTSAQLGYSYTVPFTLVCTGKYGTEDKTKIHHVQASERYRISPHCLPVKRHKKQLKRGSFVWLYFVLFAFYPHDAMLARVIAIATCPSVCPSVRHAPVLCQNEES